MIQSFVVTARGWLALLGALAFAAGAAGSQNAASVPEWRQVECELGAATGLADPYRGARICVEFRGPEGATVRSVAFADSVGTFRVRTALAPAGEWTWAVVEGPEGATFASPSGRVLVEARPAQNPLYQHGFLRVSENGRHLIHADGTPFFWLADTAWNAPWRSAAADWDEYLQRRAQQGFNVVMVHATNSKSVVEPANSAGLKPFRNGLPDPAFWNTLDQRVARANERGFVVLVAGVGRSSSLEWVEETTRPEFARYLAARLSGRFVVFSPSMDIAYDPINDEMARELGECAPRHLRTQHVNTSPAASLTYASSKYLSFASIQSGHARGDVARARRNVADWLPMTQVRAGARPTFNLEAMYDEHGDDGAPSHRRRDARQLGYLSVLHGSPGYTYGVSGVWRWTDTGAPKSWRECLEWHSAQDMTRLRLLFGGMQWWELVPAPGALLEQPDDWEGRGALAASQDRTLVVAFTPVGESIAIGEPFVPQDSVGFWFDPLTGERIAVTHPPERVKGGWRFAAPRAGEWILVVERKPKEREVEKAVEPGRIGSGPKRPPLRQESPRALAEGEIFEIVPDDYAGDEETTSPRHDLNDGVGGDSPYFRRHNVSRAHTGRGISYWYTSKYRLPGEPDCAGEQWVDYVPPFDILGSGRYRLTWRFRASEGRAYYPARVQICHAGGMEVITVPQRTGTGAVAVDLGEFDMGAHGWVRVVDDRAGSIAFGPLLLARSDSGRAQLKDERPRLVVLTDIGGDPDDTQSMIRLLVHANELDIEGLIASSAGTIGELSVAATKPEMIRELVDAYREAYPNLSRHASGFPRHEHLLAVIKSGNVERGRDAVGEGHDTEGSAWLIACVDRKDERPLNLAVWGGQTDLAQALWRVRHERGSEGLAAFAKRLRIYTIDDQDKIHDWLMNEFPGLFMVSSRALGGADKRSANYRGMYLGGDEALTSRAWVDEHLLSGHGALGSRYPTKTWTAPNPHRCVKEGDTPSWLFFLPISPGDPSRPEWGGWGGRFRAGQEGGFVDAQDLVGGAESGHATVWRWRAAVQNELAARMDWCASGEVGEANHPPRPAVDGDTSRQVIRRDAEPGASVRLSAAGTTDPDGDRIALSWWQYREAGSYAGEVTIEGAHAEHATIRMPEDSAGKTIHIILEAQDGGSPPLTRYRRVILSASSRDPRAGDDFGPR